MQQTSTTDSRMYVTHHAIPLAKTGGDGMLQPPEVRRSRVLVVDDTETNLELICMMLADEDYQLLRAQDGEQALAMVEQEDPDLVLLDVVMPGMNGMAVVRELRQREETRLLPVVLLTGMPNLEDKVQGLEAGADDFLYKPIARQELLAKVRSLLRAKQAQDAVVNHAREIERLNQELSRKNQLLQEYKDHIENDLNLARRIQLSLLPQGSLQTEGFALEGRYSPCEEVGGDFFDYLAPHNNMANIVLADISGHGMPAALLTSLIKSLCYREIKDIVNPATFLSRLNDLLQHAVAEGYFATACCLHFDGNDRTLRYSNGGHPPFILHHRNENRIEIVKHPGPILGLWSSPRFEIQTYSLQPGDRVVLYTDGLTDRLSPDHETFELHRLRNTVLDAANMDLSACLDQIATAADDFGAGGPNNDDIALIGLDIK